jgi:hypothetical protein
MIPAMSRFPLLTLLFSLLFSAPIAAAKKEVKSSAIVVKEGTIVYEKPDVVANALRLLYAGEIIDIQEIVIDPNQAKWAKVKMGEVYGYVKNGNIQYGAAVEIREWKPPVILRDEKPLSFSQKSGGELFGPGINLHYLPFSRLGLSFSVGSIIDWPEMKGTSIALGMVSYLALKDLSPFIELGFTRLSYHEKYATLRVNAFYLSGGIEWIFRSGFFFNSSLTYMRSADVEVSFDYLNAQSGLTDVPEDFGILDPGDDNTFQFVLPGFSIGYAF